MSTPEANLALARKNPFTEWTDDQLVAAAYVQGTHPPQATEVEMMRRLKSAISEQTKALLESQKTTNDLTATIKTLTVWLVVLTIVIALLTLVMVLPTLAAWYSEASGR